MSALSEAAAGGLPLQLTTITVAVPAPLSPGSAAVLSVPGMAMSQGSPLTLPGGQQDGGSFKWKYEQTRADKLGSTLVRSSLPSYTHWHRSVLLVSVPYFPQLRPVFLIFSLYSHLRPVLLVSVLHSSSPSRSPQFLPVLFGSVPYSSAPSRTPHFCPVLLSSFPYYSAPSRTPLLRPVLLISVPYSSAPSRTPRLRPILLITVPYSSFPSRTSCLRPVLLVSAPYSTSLSCIPPQLHSFNSFLRPVVLVLYSYSPSRTFRLRPKPLCSVPKIVK